MENKHKLTILAGFIAVAVLFFMAGYVSKKLPELPFSENILSVTDEVFKIQGTVTNIQGSDVTLKVEKGGQPPVEYVVRLSEQSEINQTSQMRTFRFPGVTPLPEFYGAKNSNIHIGQTLFIKSVKDLRIVKDNVIIPETITIGPEIKQISGTVLNINETSVEIEANMADIQLPGEYNPAKPSQMKKYIIRMTPETTFYQAEFRKEPLKITQADIKEKDGIAILLTEDLNKENTQPTAQIIMKKPVLPTGTPPPVQIPPAMTP